MYKVNNDDDDDDNNNNKIGATGILTRNLRRNLEAVPGKHSIDFEFGHPRCVCHNEVKYNEDSLRKRQLYLEHHTQYGKYCSVKLEA